MRTLLPLLAATCLGACGSEPEPAAPNAAAPVEIPVPAPAETPAPSPSIAPPTPEPAATATPAGDGRVSRYTSLDACRVVRSAPDEAGFAESTCPGLGGYGLKLVEADGRHNLMLVSGGREHNLRLPSISGGGFSELGKKIEWRGREEGGEFRPEGVILRYDVVENPDQPGRPISYLLPVPLQRTPCVAAKIRPGRDQNSRARAAIDGTPRCL
jgi:hypothetical protein